MIKKELENREDIKRLVIAFYEKVQKDLILGPFFNSTIKNWEKHYEILTDFWEQQLLGGKKYKGNPILVHQKVDKEQQEKITNAHFGLWLNLWFATLDELFRGDLVWVAKNRAQKMSTMLYIKIFESRTA